MLLVRYHITLNCDAFSVMKHHNSCTPRLSTYHHIKKSYTAIMDEKLWAYPSSFFPFSLCLIISLFFNTLKLFLQFKRQPSLTDQAGKCTTYRGCTTHRHTPKKKKKKKIPHYLVQSQLVMAKIDHLPICLVVTREQSFGEYGLF